MAVWQRIKIAEVANASSITATFDEGTALGTTNTLFAVLSFSGAPTDLASSSWGGSFVTGSGSNGSLNFVGGFIKRGDSSTNSITITFNSAQTAAKLYLFGFNGYTSLNLDTYAVESVASGTSTIVGPTPETTAANTIAIAAVGLSGTSGGWGSGWTNTFTGADADNSSSRSSVAVRSQNTANATPSTTRTWTTARSIREAIWVIGGTPATASTDTVAPVATITSPANSATVSGNVTVTVNATDNVGVTQVTIYSGQEILGNATNTSGNTWTYTVNSTTIPDGDYTIQARAYDAVRNSSYSNTVAISVDNSGVTPTDPESASSSFIAGTLDVDKVFAGSTAVDRILAGTELVYGTEYQGSNPTPPTTTFAAPTRVKSYGPNGTHWPASTPFFYDLANVTKVEVAASWSAISTAIVNASKNDTPTAILINQGTPSNPVTLNGNGADSGTTTAAVLKDIGRLTRTSKILVAPKNGFGSVLIGTESQAVKFDNVSNVVFALFDGSWLSAINFMGCRKTGIAWSRLGKFLRTNAQEKDYETYECDTWELVLPNVSVSNSDRTAVSGYGENSGVYNFTDYGSYIAPAYRTERAPNWPSPDEPPHTDTMQLRGNLYFGFKFVDCIHWSSQNTAMQIGGLSSQTYINRITDYYLSLEHTMFIGGPPTEALRYPADSSVPIEPRVLNNTGGINGKHNSILIGTDMGNGSGINGGGVDFKMDAKDQSFIMGGGVSSKWRTVTGDSRTRIAQSAQSGGWVADSADNYTPSILNNLSPIPTDAYLKSIWGPTPPTATQKNLPAASA